MLKNIEVITQVCEGQANEHFVYNVNFEVNE